MRVNSFITLVLCLFSACSFADSALVVKEKKGLFEIYKGGGLLLSSKYVFWGKDWAWAAQSFKFNTNAPFSYTSSGEIKKLDLHLTSKIEKIDENRASWSFDLDARSTKENVIGGGIAFNLDITELGNDLGTPVLLADNRGWRWGSSEHQGIEVSFEPALPDLFFNRGKKSDIRAFFYRGKIPKGRRHHTMTVTLYGDIKIKPTIGERFELQNSQNWLKDPIDLQTFPIDLSFLNANEKPAGKHGFISSQGDELLFADGTKGRFWGTNVNAYSLFKTSKDNIKKQAKRLSAMGFNLVRLFQHDSPWVNPNIFGPNNVRNTQHLNKESLDKLDWWIKCLKDEGIYIWLDLHLRRTFTAEDNIYGYEEIEKKKRKNIKHKGIEVRGYNYVNLTIQNAMKRFNRDYVSHVNQYTRLAYKDDPAIIAMLLTNENDITHHFANKLLPSKGVPIHNKIYMQEAKTFANKHDLSVNKTWRAWKHGPAKLFLNDLENRFNEEMIEDLREIGVKVPIVTTNTWGGNTLASLPALTTGDIIDVHAYGDVNELEKNPLFAPNMTTQMAAAHVNDKPVSVTEWNVTPFPTPGRHISSLFVASKASHQDWDAIMQYAYSQGSLNKLGKPSNWHSHNDPSLFAMLPAAALLYRKKHVKKASTTYYLSPGVALFNDVISPKTSAAIRTASEKGKLLIAMPKVESLPWLNASSPPAGAIILKDYKEALIDQSASSITSDTGELFRNWEEGVYTINTNQSQAAMGWIGNKTISLSNTEFQLTTRSATIAVQSLNEFGIDLSENILISLSSISAPYRDLKNRKKNPFLSNPVRGRLFIQAKKGLRLSYITGSGIRNDFPVNYSNGRYEIVLDKLPLIHWLQLTL